MVVLYARLCPHINSSELNLFETIKHLLIGKAFSSDAEICNPPFLSESPKAQPLLYLFEMLIIDKRSCYSPKCAYMTTLYGVGNTFLYHNINGFEDIGRKMISA